MTQTVGHNVSGGFYAKFSCLRAEWRVKIEAIGGDLRRADSLRPSM